MFTVFVLLFLRFKFANLVTLHISEVSIYISPLRNVRIHICTSRKQSPRIQSHAHFVLRWSATVTLHLEIESIKPDCVLLSNHKIMHSSTQKLLKKKKKHPRLDWLRHRCESGKCIRKFNILALPAWYRWITRDANEPNYRWRISRSVLNPTTNATRCGVYRAHTTREHAFRQYIFNNVHNSCIILNVGRAPTHTHSRLRSVANV